jgi:C-terminal processing protease CtpA/Prc
MKAMKKIHTLLLCLVALAFASCESAVMLPDEPQNPVNVFDYLWNQVDQKYTFFDVKNINWDSVREVYRPMVNDDMSDEELFKVCADMLNTLRDGHTNLFSSFDVSRNDSVYYKMYAEKNIDPDVVLLNYLTVNYHTTGSFAHNSIRDGQVAYLRYTSFSNDISDYDLKYVLNQYKDCKGLIIDLRQNGGGSIANVQQLLSIFDNHKQPLYTTQVKKGAGHNDFGDPVTVYAADSSLFGKNPYTKPVAVLIDRGSYSATSFFSVCTQGYDNIKLFGDYSGGGMGIPNGGTLPNGWNYRFSTTRTIALDGQNYENGVPPDVRVILDPAATAQGLDNVIETAADWIMQ